MTIFGSRPPRTGPPLYSYPYRGVIDALLRVLIAAARDVDDGEVVAVLKGARDTDDRLGLGRHCLGVVGAPPGDYEQVEHVRSNRRLAAGVLRVLIDEGQVLGDTEAETSLLDRLYQLAPADVEDSAYGCAVAYTLKALARAGREVHDSDVVAVLQGENFGPICPARAGGEHESYRRLVVGVLRVLIDEGEEFEYARVGALHDALNAIAPSPPLEAGPCPDLPRGWTPEEDAALREAFPRPQPPCAGVTS